MAQKTKSKSKIHLPIRKEATPSPRPWPNLPHQLITLISRQRTLMQNITSVGCVTKSWRSSPTRCRPDGEPRHLQLVEITGKKSPKNTNKTHTIDLWFHSENYSWYDKKRILSYRRPPPRICIMGHSHGYIVAMETDLSECCLWELSTFGMYLGRWRYGYYLPPWDVNLPFKIATLSSKINDPLGCNVMVVTGISSPAFAFYRHRRGRLTQKEWILENCTLKEPYALNQYMQFTNAIGFEGKFYALSLQGSLVVIEDIDSCFRITGIGGTRVVPDKASRQFREYLVESNGEILLVFLASRKSIGLVEDVEVYRLDIGKLLWEKMDSLGDRTLFLEDECCMWVTSSIMGCRTNCIYFTHYRVDEWFVYEMETTQIFPASGNGNWETKKQDEPMEDEPN
ncbi:hypothetical protein BUALT_Bualt15G0060400 [Buddleja alternifolia]|uniref:KIB1-4 beta-propeller domain-containing protein n=1 Tax=Buddleja alternifolia TaxID=168488 RepID=A0AAV6WKR1_9LAMI|nr:hypothetical protein BUALT_Bualt15G0060400 [Buddleja alternifolia]